MSATTDCVTFRPRDSDAAKAASQSTGVTIAVAKIKGTTTGSAAYFRVQGPTLIIEYAPQNSVDHIHTIYRDPTNDYGVKFAKR